MKPDRRKATVVSRARDGAFLVRRDGEFWTEAVSVLDEVGRPPKGPEAPPKGSRIDLEKVEVGRSLFRRVG